MCLANYIARPSTERRFAVVSSEGKMVRQPSTTLSAVRVAVAMYISEEKSTLRVRGNHGYLQQMKCHP